MGKASKQDIHKYIHTYIHIDKQTASQTERQINRQTDRQAVLETERQRDGRNHIHGNVNIRLS